MSNHARVKRASAGVAAALMFAAVQGAFPQTPAQASESASASKRLIDVFLATPEEGGVKAFLAKVGAALNAGADINAATSSGETPLFMATYWAIYTDYDWGANDIVAYLLARGANPNVEHRDVGNPLHMAAEAGWSNTRLIELLCAAGANPNSRSGPKKVSPLELSKSSRFPQIRQAMEACAGRK